MQNVVFVQKFSDNNYKVLCIYLILGECIMKFILLSDFDNYNNYYLMPRICEYSFENVSIVLFIACSV